MRRRADDPRAAPPAGLVVLQELASGRETEARVEYDRPRQTIAVRVIWRERREVARCAGGVSSVTMNAPEVLIGGAI